MIAFTGDAGLTMCLGELTTAIRCQCRIIIIVFNDACLSLIDIKQKRRAMHQSGVTTRQPKFAALMRTMDGKAWIASDQSEYQQALCQAIAVNRPCLFDARIDPAPYSAQIEALRG